MREFFGKRRCRCLLFFYESCKENAGDFRNKIRVYEKKYRSFLNFFIFWLLWRRRLDPSSPPRRTKTKFMQFFRWTCVVMCKEMSNARNGNYSAIVIFQRANAFFAPAKLRRTSLVCIRVGSEKLNVYGLFTRFERQEWECQKLVTFIEIPYHKNGRLVRAFPSPHPFQFPNVKGKRLCFTPSTLPPPRPSPLWEVSRKNIKKKREREREREKEKENTSLNMHKTISVPRSDIFFRS